MLTGLINRIIILAICGAVGVGIGLGVTYVQSAPIRAGQETAKQILGNKASLCSTTDLKKVTTRKVNLDGKIAVIHVQDGTLYQPYQEALRAKRQPQNPSEVAGVLCLVDSQSVYDTDYYGESRTYSCVRYAHDFNAYLIDAETGKVVAYDKIDGPEPDTCPDKTDSSLTRYGQPPDPADVAAWVK